MTDTTSRDPASPDDERRHWHAALALFDALQDLAPEERERRLRDGAHAPEVLDMVARLFATLDTSCIVDRPFPALAADPSRAPWAEATNTLAGQRLGRWLLVEPLGAGGMATVWRARSLAPPLGQWAALKLLRIGLARDEDKARFEREARILATLHHPGIAPVYDAGHADDGTPWFAMALVDGETIDAWCERRGADVATRVDLVIQAADAAAHAHRHLVVHRDIKPANVMVDADGRVTLLDFGISRLLEEVDGATGTDDGDRVGQTRAFTPRYAAPEQMHGTTAPTTATDVYGLAALLHHLVLGVPPQWPEGAEACRDPATVGRATSDATLRAQLRGDLGAILRKALARSPDARYRSAAELAADLVAWRRGMPVMARAGGPAYRLRRWAGRHRLAAALALALLASLAAGVTGVVWQAHEARLEARAARAAEAEAEQARQRAERALARAESLNGFILDLFRANAPERPADQLPTTAELLALGVERANDPASAEPEVRAQMLVAIGRIYALRGRIVDADALAGRAASLAREARAAAPDTAEPVLIDALRLRGETAAARSDFKAADAALREAEQLMQAQPAPGPGLIEVGRDRGMMLARQQRYAEAAEVFERVRTRAQGRDDIDEALLRSLDGALAVSYSTLRRHDRAEPLFARQVEYRARNRAKDALRHAVALANHGRNRLYLGDFADAERKLDEAIATYDTLFDGPNGYRAAARLNRSQLYARQRRFDDALAEADAASREWAAADGTPLDQDPFVHGNRLEALVLAERWPRLAREAAATVAKLPADDDYRDTRMRAESLLALARCEVGEVDAGTAALASALKARASAPWVDPVVSATLDEARARCAAAAGDLGRALAALAEATALDDAHPPGDAGEIARRERLAATWLAQVGRTDEARRANASADARLRALAPPTGRPWPRAGGDGQR